MINVWDASAVFVLLNGEAGADAATARHARADNVIAAVNYAEVMSKLADWGSTAEAADAMWAMLSIAVVPASEAQAHAAGALRSATRRWGLSLGDRFCLALAGSLDDAVVVTADRAWKSVKGFTFDFVR